MLLVLAVVFGVVFVLRWRKEPRRLSNGVWAVLAIGFGLLAGATLGGPLALPFGIAILVLCLAAAVSMPVAAAFLIGNGVVMLRRERPTPGNLVGLAVGIGLVAIMVITVVLLASRMPPAIIAAVWLSLVSSYFAFVFVCFATFCLLYARRRRRHPVEAVVILGSGVRDGRVPPLLAARLTRALELRAEHLAAGWPVPLLVPSGGQGPDEIEPEAESMARWLRDHDVPSDAILVESRARTTEENLRFSADLVAERSAGRERDADAGSDTSRLRSTAGGLESTAGGLESTDGGLESTDGDPGPRAESRGPSDAVIPASTTHSTELVAVPGSLAVVTNDYHAFRAALQARRLGLDADAVGARTASYFVPSAYLREFVAVLREHRWTHVIVVAAITIGVGLPAWSIQWAGAGG